jgi:hypothetical protein
MFGHLVPHTSYDTGWVFLAIVCFAFALLGLAGRNPTTAFERTDTGKPVPTQHLASSGIATPSPTAP